MIGARQSTDRDLPVRLVDRFDVDVEIGAKNLALATLQGDAIEAGQRIRRQAAAPPSNDVTIIVVMRRLDQNKPETPDRTHNSLPCSREQSGTQIEEACLAADSKSRLQ